MLNEVRTFDFFCLWATLINIVVFAFPLGNENDEDTNADTLIDGEAMDVDDTVVADPDSSSFVTFDCTEPYCIKQFRREDRLRAYLLLGSHKIVASSVRFLDRAMLMYHDSLLSDHPKQVPALSTSSISKKDITNSSITLEEGWALFYPRPKVAFTVAQRSYLDQKYDEGEKCGTKWDPASVAEASLFFLKASFLK